jgi:uncharacterized Ntn-hydrolase superfamily protein
MNLHDLYATYSIVARDADTGQYGVAVQTHQMSVGRVVPFMLPGVGAVATQSLVNVSFGPLGLDFLREGFSAEQIIDGLIAADSNPTRRQVAVVDTQGRAAAYTGSGCIPYAGHHIGEGYSVQANMMTNDTVIVAMVSAYEGASGDLAQRMLAALQAAQAEDGDIRGTQSAALKVVSGDRSEPAWQAVFDLRVDEHTAPVVEMARLVRLRHAQLVSARGNEALEQGRREEALQIWQQAREEAPELEEVAFWQAITLADGQNDVTAAADILGPVMQNDLRRAHWLDLLTRLDECGFIEHAGAGAALRAAIE